MSVLRYKILISADSSADTSVAIEKAKTIAGTIGAEIHILNVINTPFASAVAGAETGFPLLPLIHENQQGNNTRQVENYKWKNIRSIFSTVVHESKRKATLEYIFQNDIDLVIIGISKINYFKRIGTQLFIRHISEHAKIPVLSVNRSQGLEIIKKIVIPLSSNIPLKALKMAATMGKAFGSTIYVVGIAPVSGIINNTMDTTIEFIHSISSVKVQGYFLEGKNLIKGTLKFSKKIKADLIMIDPFKEFSLPGFFNKITKSILPDDKENYIVVNN